MSVALKMIIDSGARITPLKTKSDESDIDAHQQDDGVDTDITAQNIAFQYRPHTDYN